jgi:alpha-galactosidase
MGQRDGRVAEIPVDTAAARIYEHGWQSWSPSTTYRATDPPLRAADADAHVMGERPEKPPPAGAFQGEGLLALQPEAEGTVHVFAAPDARSEVPSIQASLRDGRVVVSADGPVEHRLDDGRGGIDAALARWAGAYAGAVGVPVIRRAPTAWCSWYQYFDAVTEADILENLDRIEDLELTVDVVQLDDGYETEIGDWLSLSDRFESLEDLSGRIRSRGRRAGIWVAPFLVGERSATAAAHPEWLVGGPDAPVSAGHNWGQTVHALDTTHPAALAYLVDVFSTFRTWGYDYFKIDFMYAGAMTGRRLRDVTPLEAYRQGVETIRGTIGDAYLLGCGAPILPSVGLFDAMRISPDTAPHLEPVGGDMSKPSSRSAMITGAGRAFQQGRFWVNDPDCLIVRPEIEGREEWAAHVERYGGLRASSDRLADLDEWGLETTRRLLAGSPVEPFVPG